MKNTKIVVLDGFTLSPLSLGENSDSHPSWEALAALGDLVLHERTAAAEVAARAAGAEVVLTNKALLPAHVINALPDLKYIGVMATGTNVVDLEAAKSRGIPVANVPGYSTDSVVQTVFGLLFEVNSRIGETALRVRDGGWAGCSDFSFTLSPWSELAGKKFGVIGYGAIGSGVARVALALGMEVLVSSRSAKTLPTGARQVDLDTLFAEADVISLHCPLTPETKHLIRAETIAKMKRGVMIINTGRGPLIEESETAAALRDGNLGGFGADVLSAEPPSADNPLLDAPRTVITPHLAWASIEARHRLMNDVAGNVEAWMAGSPRNVVN